jgi:cobaltochelatase CobN
LLEAARKGDWKADEVTRRELAQEYAASVAKHGDSSGLATGGNQKLRAEVVAQLNAPGDADLAALAEAYQVSVAQSARPLPGSPGAVAAAPAETPEVVSGAEMKSASSTATSDNPARAWLAAGVGGVAAALILIGMFRRGRVA